MKKLLALLLALVMVLCLMTACNNENDTETTGGTEPTESIGDVQPTGDPQPSDDDSTEPTQTEAVVSGADIAEDLPASDGELETIDYSTMPASDGDLEDGE